MKVGGVQYCCLGKWLHKCTEEAIQGYSMHHMTLVSLATPSLTHERGSGQAAIVELC